MPEQKAHIVNLLSVPLTKDKQMALQSEFQVYASATNYIIKLMIQRQINSIPKALETLGEDFKKKLLILTTSSDSSELASSASSSSQFESVFNPHNVERYRAAVVPREGTEDIGVVDWYVLQYFRDVVRTAMAEIARHRRLAMTVRSLRDRTPYLKFGRMILSARIASITETGCIILATNGNEIPIPFDKRSKSRELALLHSIAAGQQKYDRIRLKWHNEGYVDIDIRLGVSVFR